MSKSCLILDAGWPVFCLNKVKAKNINAAEAKRKQSIGVCVASVVGILTQTYQSRQKILSGKAMKNSKEPFWPGNFSPTEPDKTFYDLLKRTLRIKPDVR